MGLVMQTDWLIHPYVGVGAAKLGMTQGQVAAILGPPDDADVDSETDEIREERKAAALQAVFSADEGQLVELGFSPPIAELELDGVRLFSVPPDQALRHVIQRDPDPRIIHGFIVFLSLGITMTGFHNNDEAQKAVTIFAKGRWDSVKPKLKPFTYNV
jgi:hypothetical protein